MLNFIAGHFLSNLKKVKLEPIGFSIVFSCNFFFSSIFFLIGKLENVIYWRTYLCEAYDLLFTTKVSSEIDLLHRQIQRKKVIKIVIFHSITRKAYSFPVFIDIPELLNYL